MSEQFEGNDYDDYDDDAVGFNDPYAGSDDAGEAEAWTLGELHASADLGSLRSAGFFAEERFA